MKKNAIEVFGEWADLDKDFGMEKNHKDSVISMINYSIKNLNHFTFIDAGCGNGWVIRKVSENKKCEKAIGVDGSKKMIAKAKKILPGYEYHCADLMTWRPQEKVNIVHSMEVIYYVEDPKKLINDIFDFWLKPNGRLIIGIDFYFENKISHSWPESCGIKDMKLFSEKDWMNFFISAGYNDIKSWRYGEKEDWKGTLVVTGIK